MESPVNGVDCGTDTAPPRLENLYPEFLSAVLDGIREDAERMKKYRADIGAACKAAKCKATQLLEEWRSAQLDDRERRKIEEARVLCEKAAKTVFLSESLSMFNRALSAIEETRQMYLARREEEEKARRRAEEEAARIKAAEEERRRLAEEESKRQEEERKRQQDARMAKIGLYLILGLMAAVVVQAIRMHWSASLLGLFASFIPPFLWPLTAPKNRPWAVVLGIVGLVAIPMPLVPIISHQLNEAWIPVGIALVAWLVICSVAVPLTRGHIWAHILVILPMLAGRCDFSELDGFDWAKLLRAWPRFADKCDWLKLDGKDWSKLLKRRPQFADKCDWSKLDGIDWATLLGKRPQFADKCDWAKLGNVAWGQLLQTQPQFTSRRVK